LYNALKAAILIDAASRLFTKPSLQVLGLSPTANSEAVNRTYKRLLAENRQNDAAKARIESAHSAIMMSQLTARLQVTLAAGIFPLQSFGCNGTSRESLVIF